MKPELPCRVLVAARSIGGRRGCTHGLGYVVLLHGRHHRAHITEAIVREGRQRLAASIGQTALGLQMLRLLLVLSALLEAKGVEAVACTMLTRWGPCTDRECKGWQPPA